VELPALTGQPAWVVIVVGALFALAGFSAAVLRKRRKKSADEDDEAGVGVKVVNQAAAGITDAPIQAALDHLAEIIREERKESEAARRETRQIRREADTMRDELVRVKTELDSMRSRLQACEERMFPHQEKL
jgi:LPXTG-motif cell wall-anchored protein